MRNLFYEDLVHLMGGQSLADDAAEYPRINKILCKVRGKRQLVDGKHIEKV